MSISVYTQYMENYGEAEGFNSWKFKWGMKYIVELSLIHISEPTRPY